MTADFTEQKERKQNTFKSLLKRPSGILWSGFLSDTEDVGDNLFSVLLSVIHSITDSEHLKRRLHLSTVHKEVSVTLLHAKIPFVGLKRNIVSV